MAVDFIIHSQTDDDTEVQGTINVKYGKTVIENTSSEVTKDVTDSFAKWENRFSDL